MNPNDSPIPTTRLGIYLADVRTAFAIGEYKYALPGFLFNLLPSVRRRRKSVKPAIPCPAPAAKCTCANGIGCINVPFDRW